MGHWLLFLAVLQQPDGQDSIRVLKEARSSQARFERQRRQHMAPHHDPPPDHCDIYIGRFCFTLGDPGEVYQPPPERKEIVPLREELLARLQGALDTVPGEPWIRGQRVRYAIEAGRPGDAETAARECRSESWWCHALLGLVLHVQGYFDQAETAYDAARNAMPAALRCEWDDISELVQGDPADRYRELPCGARDSMEARFWWLSDPLYLTPGNERRTEHYFRRVMIALQQDALPPTHDYWSDAHEESVLRIGWPDGWQRKTRMSAGPGGGDIVELFRGPLASFDPPEAVMHELREALPGRWPLVRGNPRALYLPRYVRKFDSLATQVAVFHRADSIVVVAGFDLSGDSVPPDRAARAGLFLAPAAGMGQSAEAVTRAVGNLALKAPARAGLVSVELLAADSSRAGRARYWLPAAAISPGRIAVSDILLLSRADTLPGDLREAAFLARGSTTFDESDTLALYWETYGLGPQSAEYAVSLTLVKESSSFFTRAARTLGLAGEQRPQVRLEWQDRSPGGLTYAPGRLTLALSGNDPGRYTVRLEVSANGVRAASERGITVRRAG